MLFDGVFYVCKIMRPLTIQSNMNFIKSFCRTFSGISSKKYIRSFSKFETNVCILYHLVCKDVATAKIIDQASDNERVMSVRLNAASIGKDFKENCSFDGDVQATFYINQQHQMIPIFSKKVQVIDNVETMKVFC